MGLSAICRRRCYVNTAWGSDPFRNCRRPPRMRLADADGSRVRCGRSWLGEWPGLPAMALLAALWRSLALKICDAYLTKSNLSTNIPHAYPQGSSRQGISRVWQATRLINGEEA